MGKDSLTITNNATGQSEEFPLLKGTHGPDVADIRQLYQKMGIFTFDPGYKSTASCESKITFIDGEKGILLYRGYPIEQLAEKSSFLEVCYLVLNGELPTENEFDHFDKMITHHSLVQESFREYETDIDTLPHHIKTRRKS